MANEISIQINLQHANPSTVPSAAGQLKSAWQPSIPRITQSGQARFERVVSLTTSETALSFTGITTQGWCAMQNLDSSSVVEYGPESGGSMVSLGQMKAGEVALFRLKAGVTLRIKSVSGTPKAWVQVWED